MSTPEERARDRATQRRPGPHSQHVSPRTARGNLSVPSQSTGAHAQHSSCSLSPPSKRDSIANVAAVQVGPGRRQPRSGSSVEVGLRPAGQLPRPHERLRTGVSVPLSPWTPTCVVRAPHRAPLTGSGPVWSPGAGMPACSVWVATEGARMHSLSMKNGRRLRAHARTHTAAHAEHGRATASTTRGRARPSVA